MPNCLQNIFIISPLPSSNVWEHTFAVLWLPVPFVLTFSLRKMDTSLDKHFGFSFLHCWQSPYFWVHGKLRQMRGTQDFLHWIFERGCERNDARIGNKSWKPQTFAQLPSSFLTSNLCLGVGRKNSGADLYKWELWLEALFQTVCKGANFEWWGFHFFFKVERAWKGVQVGSPVS